MGALRQALALFDEELRHGFAGASDSLNERLREAYERLNGINPQQTATVQSLLRTFAGINDSLGEEILAIQQHIEMMISLGP